jgi:hypothetical protein
MAPPRSLRQARATGSIILLAGFPLLAGVLVIYRHGTTLRPLENCACVWPGPQFIGGCDHASLSVFPGRRRSGRVRARSCWCGIRGKIMAVALLLVVSFIPPSGEGP